MKKLTLILDNTNWLEAAWSEEIITQVEGEEDKVETTQLWCESYSGHKEHIAMLRSKALEFGTSLDEYEDLIAECIANFVEEDKSEEIEANRIACIKGEAKNIIESKYPVYKQMNILMSGVVVDIELMNEFIARIREISNEAERTGLEYNQIDWRLNNGMVAK